MRRPLFLPSTPVVILYRLTQNSRTEKCGLKETERLKI